MLENYFDREIFSWKSKNPNIYNGDPIANVYIFYVFGKSRIFHIFYLVFDQKTAPKIFSTKINFERKKIDLIENFCIRRVNIKCFSLSSGNVFNAIQRDEFILSLKGEHLRQVFGLLLGRGDF